MKYKGQEGNKKEQELLIGFLLFFIFALPNSSMQIIAIYHCKDRKKNAVFRIKPFAEF